MEKCECRECLADPENACNCDCDFDLMCEGCQQAYLESLERDYDESIVYGRN